MLSRPGDQKVGEVDAFERPMHARQRRHKTHESSETSHIDMFLKEQWAVAGEDNFSLSFFFFFFLWQNILLLPSPQPS